MLGFVRSLLSGEQWLLRLVPFVVALVVAEFLFKFKSFTLECVAFLALWFVLDVLVEQFRRRS
jgi:hypothetical protein